MKKESTEYALHLIEHLTKIGVALSAERDIPRLLELIIDEACHLTSADGGTLYIKSDDGQYLDFAIVLNKSLGVRMGGGGEKINWPPVMLLDGQCRQNLANVSAYAALKGKVVNIPDVYNAEGFNFEGTRQFDSRTGYRSQSMLVVPMRNHEQEIIGVLQLLNATEEGSREVIAFSRESQMITESFASQAAVALSQKRLIQDLENLLEAFVKTIAMAVDEKSPYTGGHIRRVADITMAIADKINKNDKGPFSDVKFSDDQMKELRFAAWLHDLGKIATPEYVVDKTTKLETIFDRMELIRTRGEVVMRDHKSAMMRQWPATAGEVRSSQNSEEDFDGKLREDMDFLVEVNNGSKPLGGEELVRLQAIGARKWVRAGRVEAFLTENELLNLRVPRGTLTDQEREIINNHAVVTHKLLSQLPFPKKLRDVHNFAGSHHEKLNGSGYPRGLKEADIPLQARILVLADIFEALTAKDRPYKRGNTLSEAVAILSGMVKAQHLDADLFTLFMDEKIYLDYARREMNPQQIDKTDFSA
jgi:HD-GYP domain-containing protein (c-di-GMP phosphodiesterase class II)